MFINLETPSQSMRQQLGQTLVASTLKVTKVETIKNVEIRD